MRFLPLVFSLLLLITDLPTEKKDQMFVRDFCKFGGVFI